MSFRAFSDSAINQMISEASSAERLTVVVGAGASMEAGLPSWEALVERLVIRAGRESELIERANDPVAEQKWVREVSREGSIGAAAIVDALAKGGRDRLLEEELFGEGQGPSNYLPGEISIQLARLRSAFGPSLRILTTNYDDLIEQAFRTEGEVEPFSIATDDHRCDPSQVEVFHLHGYLGRDERPRGKLILSEADYQEMQRGSCWQEQLVESAMRDSTFLFVGTSLADPNMLRYLHHSDSPREIPRFAVFVRQGTYAQDVNPDVVRARESALVARWRSVGVEPIFVDHYQDVAQLIHEIGRSRAEGPQYVPLPERGARWVETVEQELLGFNTNAFETAQRAVVEQLAKALKLAIKAAEELEGRAWDETIAMSMWLVDRTGEHLTNWATTDRIHIDPATVDPVKIDEHARWVAVRAFCQGLPLAEERDIYASRWHFIRGLPLVVEDLPAGRLPVGCLTIATMSTSADTMLNVMDDAVESAFNDTLRTATLDLLGQSFLDADSAPDGGSMDL